MKKVSFGAKKAKKRGILDSHDEASTDSDFEMNIGRKKKKDLADSAQERSTRKKKLNYDWEESDISEEEVKPRSKKKKKKETSSEEEFDEDALCQDKSEEEEEEPDFVEQDSDSE